MKKIYLMLIFVCAILMSCTNKIEATNNNNISTTNNDTNNNNNNNVSVNTKKLKITTTIFPIYDYIKNVMGTEFDKNDVVMLFKNGIDLHNYQLSVGDMMEIGSSDMFIYVGGESDERWVPRALEKMSSVDKAINLLDTLGQKVIYEKNEEWMDEEENSEENEEGPEADEHIWLSIENSKYFVQVIADKLGELDTINADKYKTNADNYIKELDALESKFKNVVDNKKVDTIVFGDRFPFRYLFDELGLNYYMAFNGCSAETEASFKTIEFLSSKVDEYNLNYVLRLKGSTNGIAKTIVGNTKNKNQQIVEMTSCENVFMDAVKNNDVSYIKLMEENLSVLSKVLEN